jgi:tRNA-dihydrouridine synthase A
MDKTRKTADISPRKLEMKPLPTINHRLCIAPMMDCTDRHCRVLHRIITRHALLYTEMVTAAAVKFGKREQLLGYSEREKPVALQLGGAEPAELALAARIGEEFGFAEINLNCGCPSNRVKDGRFGACLMAEPMRVADCISAMRGATALPVTVKCRIGIDDQDVEEALDSFADAVKRAGCATLIVHARKAWLDGLSPRENRDIPPLDHQRVYRLKRRHPDLPVIINGGIRSLDEAESHLAHLDGVMLGRAAYGDPYVLAEVDCRFFASSRPPLSRQEILAAYLPYVETELAEGTLFPHLARPLLGLFHGRYGGRLFRRILSEQGHKPGAGVGVLLDAVAATEADGRLLAAE